MTWSGGVFFGQPITMVACGAAQTASAAVRKEGLDGQGELET